MQHYSVIVIGAGPAGSTTAKICAKAGLKTLILEKDKFPGEKNACAGGINPYTRKKLKIPEEIIERDITSIRLYSEGFLSKQLSPAIVPFLSKGVTVRREKFDSWLAENAVQEGAELKTNSYVTKVSENRAYTAKETYAADIIVGADGINSKVAEAMSFKKFKPHELATGIVYEIAMPEERISEKFGNGVELYFDSKLARNGYAWVFPGKNFLNVGIGGISSKNSNIKEKLDLFCKKTQIKGKILTFKAGLVPVCGTRFPLAKENKLLVGDAAGHTGAAFGEGIFYAIQNGEIAGSEIVKHFEKNSSFMGYNLKSLLMYGPAHAIELHVKWLMQLAEDLNTMPLLFKLLEIPPINIGVAQWTKRERNILKLFGIK